MSFNGLEAIQIINDKSEGNSIFFSTAEEMNELLSTGTPAEVDEIQLRDLSIGIIKEDK